MTAQTESCTICGTRFEVHFSYQVEERVERDDDGRLQARTLRFCSQRCLEESHQGGRDGTVSCDGCRAAFRVVLASQVLFTRGRRRYACSPECRSRIQSETGATRLGEAFAPGDGDGQTHALPAVLDPARATLPAPADSAGAVASVTPLRVRRQPGDAPQALAVFNHKGGTGKTTTAVTLAAGLASRGRKVLLVDTDGQGNVAASLGLETDRSLYHVLVMGLPLRDAVQEALPGLDVLPANETLAAAELYLAGRRNRDRVLSSRLDEARAAYDHIVVDCSPSLSLMNQNALVFADGVLCPVACDYLSLMGVRQVLRTIKQVNKLLSRPVQLWGVLPTLFDARARICHEALDTLKEHFGQRCFSPVHLAIKVKEAPSQGKTLLDYAPGSSAAKDYLAVVDALIPAHGAGGAPVLPATAGGIG